MPFWTLTKEFMCFSFLFSHFISLFYANLPFVLQSEIVSFTLSQTSDRFNIFLKISCPFWNHFIIIIIIWGSLFVRHRQ